MTKKPSVVVTGRHTASFVFQLFRLYDLYLTLLCLRAYLKPPLTRLSYLRKQAREATEGQPSAVTQDRLR
jgi:hypothetical protein